MILVLSVVLLVTFSHSQVSSTLLVHEVTLTNFTPRCSRVDLYKYFFSQRIIDVWNNLPAKSHDFSSLARFTRLVKITDLSQFLSLGYY